jgi:DNA-binding NarL/FixJ family response regulator
MPSFSSGAEPFIRGEFIAHVRAALTPLSQLNCRLRPSRRECQVVDGVLGDLKESAIALRLGLSPQTVHGYLKRVYRKLDVHDRGGLHRRIFHEWLSLNARFDPGASSSVRIPYAP